MGKFNFCFISGRLLRWAASFSCCSCAWIIPDLCVCVFFDNPEENFISSLLGGVYYPGLTLGVQLKPKPVPLGLWVARMGSVMPLPSGPRPIPGLQPMVCSMRFPMLVSGIGGAFSPTTPGNKVHRLKKANNFCLRILTHTMLNTTYKCQL